MLTTEDANTYHDVYPNRKIVGPSGILDAFSVSATIVGEAPSRTSGHVGSSL